MSTVNTFASIETYINSIDEETIAKYRAYWSGVTPRTDQEFYARWVFAFLSVHTTWERNVSAFNTMNPTKEKLASKQQLQEQIILSKVGLHNMRTTGIWKFHEDFWANPTVWRKTADETWLAYRDRVMSRCFGLKEAKTSFALELCYPNDAEVVCLDTHMLQLYGCTKKGSPAPKKYRELEAHWLACCRNRNLPSFAVRNVYWDKVQQQTDTKYWSYVFEQTEQNESTGQAQVGQGAAVG